MSATRKSSASAAAKEKEKAKALAAEAEPVESPHVDMDEEENAGPRLVTALEARKEFLLQLSKITFQKLYVMFYNFTFELRHSLFFVTGKWHNRRGC